MTQFTAQRFTVGAKTSKEEIPCTEKWHGWPMRDGKCCDITGKSADGDK